MKCFVAESTLKGFVSGVCEPMTLVVALLVETFAADVTDERLDALVDAPVSVERRRSVERLPARDAAMRFLGGVDDLVTTERRRLAKALAAHLSDITAMNYCRVAVA